MIGIDTNVLVRYLTQDDPRQAALATRLIEALTDDAPGFISCVVLVETAWVLESCYGVGRAALGQIFETLLRTNSLHVERADSAWRALRRCGSGGDFADALISELGTAAGCELTYSFDRKAVKFSGMTLLE